MKLLLLTLVCFTAVLAAPADKQKRDILPGDPRYGTENHNHEHHENENEVQPALTYGPPNHTPGKPVGTDLLASSDIGKTSNVFVPATSYGIPDTTQLFNNNFLGSVIDNKKSNQELSNLFKTTIQEQPKFDTLNLQKTVIPEIHHEVQQPVFLKNGETIPQISLPQVKATASHVPTEAQGVIGHGVSSFSPLFKSPLFYSSYSNIPIKTVDHQVQIKVPHPYHVPVTKNVRIPIPVPHTVEIPKPYYVRVPQPVQVTVDQPYPVEIPRPVPYPVPHYVKSKVPVAHHVVDNTKASPFQTFFDNTQTSFQNVISGLPTFSNPLESFHNPFENFDVSSIPGISFIPSLIQGTGATSEHISTPSLITGDSIAIDNPALKPETTVTKTSFVKPIFTSSIGKTKTHGNKPSIACAGCTVTSANNGASGGYASNKQEYVQPADANGDYTSNKQEYVQPIDANGGYVY